MKAYSAVPAYGRDYKSKKAVMADWEAGRDFLILDPLMGSTYVNKEDKPSNVVLNVRYNRRTQVCVIK